MRPVLFNFFGLEIHSYGLMLAIAFLVGIYGAGKSVRRFNVNFDIMIDLGIWALIGAVLGARIAYVITEYPYFLDAPVEIFKINSGGLAFHGGLFGGFLAGYWFTKIKKLDTWKIADVIAPFLALGYTIVRIGCFFNGCCYGKVSSLPWAMQCSAHDSILRHPTQLYSMIGSFGLFIILTGMRNHKRFSGFLFLLYIGMYSVMRFIVEIFREGPMIYPWLSLAQLVCVILGVFAFGLIWILEARHQKRGLKVDAASEINS